MYPGVECVCCTYKHYDIGGTNVLRLCTKVIYDTEEKNDRDIVEHRRRIRSKLKLEGMERGGGGG